MLSSNVDTMEKREEAIKSTLVTYQISASEEAAGTEKNKAMHSMPYSGVYHQGNL